MFKFNFDNSEAESITNGDEKEEGALQGPKIEWLPAKEHFLDSTHLELLNDDVNICSYEYSPDHPALLHLDCLDVSLKLQQRYGDDNPITNALHEKCDLQPGLYEGGLKIWECSKDLVCYLNSNVDPEEWRGKNVLELGCGAGLPGILCFKNGAHVDFQDYNPEVIENLTIPNVLVNIPDDMHSESRFYSGDWSSLEKRIREEGKKYDVILTSETIYNISNQKKLVSLFDACLKENGRVYLAAKMHYFGVGGGLRQFESVIDADGQKWKHLSVFKVESDFKREIILITRNKNI